MSKSPTSRRAKLTESVRFRLCDRQFAALHAAAAEENVTVSELLRRAVRLEELVERHDGGNGNAD